MSYQFNPFTGTFDAVGTTGGPGPGPSVWTNGNLTITSSSSSVINSEAMSSFQTDFYFITIKRVSDNAVRSFNFTVTNDNGSLKDVVHNRIGSNLNIEIDAIINGLDYEVVVTNNNASDIEVSYIKSLI